MKAKIQQNNFVRVEKYLQNTYEFRYNEVFNEIEYRQKNQPEFKPLNENEIYRELMHLNYKISQANLAALFRSDFVVAYNPFLYYFENQPVWDGKTDYINQLANYIAAKNQDHFNHHFKKHLVRTVACALDERYYNKQVFILVSDKQNSGKSSFCRFLCPPALIDYFTESINPDNKDGEITLTENFIINLDELSVLSKADINKLKSFFSRQRVKVRRPFEKKATSAPRRASFVGSTNKMEFLSDETGSVRWLCFEVGKIRWEEYIKEVDINKVWAQAYALYKSDDFKYDLTAQEIADNELHNQKYNQTTPELELIQKLWEPATSIDHHDFKTATEIMLELQSKFSTKSFHTSPEKIGKALKTLGFNCISKRTEIKTYPIKGYYVKNINSDNQPDTPSTETESPFINAEIGNKLSI